MLIRQVRIPTPETCDSRDRWQTFEMKIVLKFITTILFLLLTIFSVGGGHESYLLAKLIYPYTMLIANCKNEIGIPGIILAIVQIPIYALILIKKPIWKYYVFGFHIIGIIINLNINYEAF